jgi:hypothetical protein
MSTTTIRTRLLWRATTAAVLALTLSSGAALADPGDVADDVAEALALADPHVQADDSTVTGCMTSDPEPLA